MGILDQPPEDFNYVDYRPMLNQSIMNAVGAFAAAAAARGLMKGFGRKTGKGFSGSKTKMKGGSVNLNKRPGKGPSLKKERVGKKSSRSDLPPMYQEESLPMYSKGNYVDKKPPPLPPRKKSIIPKDAPPTYSEATKPFSLPKPPEPLLGNKARAARKQATWVKFDKPQTPKKLSPVEKAKKQIAEGRNRMAALKAKVSPVEEAKKQIAQGRNRMAALKAKASKAK